MAARTPAGFSQPLQRFVSSAVACCRMAVTQPYTWLSCCQTAADVMALCLWQQRKARCALRLLTDVACAVASVSCCRCYRVLTLSARHGYRPFHAMQDVLSESNGSLHVTSGSVWGPYRAPEGTWCMAQTLWVARLFCLYKRYICTVRQPRSAACAAFQQPICLPAVIWGHHPA